MSAGSRSLRSWASLGWLPLLAVLSACAGSPWGERLAGSFPPAAETPAQPEAPKPADNASASDPSPRPTSTPNPSLPATQPTAPPNATAKPAATPAASATATTKPAAAAKPNGTKPATPPAGSGKPAGTPAAAPSPVPYRISLRLPRADPSAPAEAVTQALRAAGIAFEVETIERVPAGASTPTVRPAPPPR